MKALGFALALALGAAAWQAAPFGQPAEGVQAVTAGIDGRGSERSDCVRADGDRQSGCAGDELRPIVVAGITGTG